MKKYRITFRFSDRPESSLTKTEEVYADAWRVDSDQVCLYRRDREGEMKVFDVPRSRVTRIMEV